MNINDAFYIGYITKTRGLKGELQLYFDFSDYTELEWDVIFVEIDKKLVPYFLKSIKLQHNSTAYLLLEDVDHIDKTTELIKKRVYLSKDKMPERDEDDFRYTDFVGYFVRDEQEGDVGEIIDVQEMPQQFIAVVDFSGKELMFPLSEDLILAVDGENKTVEVNLPNGLIDLYRDR